jgi:hypothetical protein
MCALYAPIETLLVEQSTAGDKPPLAIEMAVHPEIEAGSLNVYALEWSLRKTERSCVEHC